MIFPTNLKLANERTFLAWLRTSLVITSIGIALAQLNRFVEDHSTISITGLTITIPLPLGDPTLVSLGAPLGALCILIGIIILLVGAFRFYHTEYLLQHGKYPVSRATSIFLTSASILVMVLFLVSAVRM